MGLWLAGVATAWGFLYRIQSDNAEAGGLWADVEAEPPQGSADTSFTLFLLEKNPCTVTPEPGSKEKLAGYRLQISWRGFKKRHHKMDFREQVVPFVMAGATISCVFSLRPDSLFPPSVFTLTLIMENIAGSSFLHIYIFFPTNCTMFLPMGSSSL